jgi:hypothetical protein
MNKYLELEKTIHAIKGASNNVGIGGISELLTEFHHYLRTNEANIDKESVEHYFKHLSNYTQALKQQYS